MNGVILHTDEKWANFPYYNAQVGDFDMGLVEVNPATGFISGQSVQFAVLGSYGTTPWQPGIVSSVSEGFVFIGTI